MGSPVYPIVCSLYMEDFDTKTFPAAPHPLACAASELNPGIVAYALAHRVPEIFAYLVLITHSNFNGRRSRCILCDSQSIRHKKYDGKTRQG